MPVTPMTDQNIADIRRMVDDDGVKVLMDYNTERFVARIEILIHTTASQASKLAQLQNALATERMHSKSMSDISGEFAKRDKHIERLRSALRSVVLCVIDEKPNGEGERLKAWVADLEQMNQASFDIAYDALQLKVEG